MKQLKKEKISGGLRSLEVFRRLEKREKDRVRLGEVKERLRELELRRVREGVVGMGGGGAVSGYDELIGVDSKRLKKRMV